MMGKSLDIGIRNDALIKEYRETGNEDAREEFFRENLRLVNYLAQRFENIGDSHDERVSIGSYGLLKAFNTFKLDAGIKFATYATKCINNEFFMYFRRRRKQFGRLVFLDEPINIDHDGNELTRADTFQVEENFEDHADNELIQQALEYLRSKLPERNYLIFEECFIKGRRQDEVAKDLGISQSYISRIVKKGLHTVHKIGKKLLDEPKELKTMAGTGYKASVRTHKGEIPSADANGMIAYLLDNTGATGMTISRFLGVSQSQVSTVKRRLDGSSRYEHVHPVLHGFNMDDLFKEQTKTVEKKSVTKLTEDFEKPLKEAQEMEHGTISLDVDAYAKKVREAVQKDLEVAQKHMSTPKVDTEITGDTQDEDSHLKALEEFADKIVEDRALIRESDLVEVGTLNVDAKEGDSIMKLSESIADSLDINKDEVLRNLEKEHAWKTMEKDLGIAPYPPLPKQRVEALSLNTKGTGLVLAEMITVLVRALDPEKTYELTTSFFEVVKVD